MNPSPPRRLWIELMLGLGSAAMLAATTVWPDWIERILGLEPDGGDGSAEWGLAIALAVVTLVCFADAGLTWWRTTMRLRAGPR